VYTETRTAAWHRHSTAITTTAVEISTEDNRASSSNNKTAEIIVSEVVRSPGFINAQRTDFILQTPQHNDNSITDSNVVHGFQ
jgi:hypothetical protein